MREQRKLGQLVSEAEYSISVTLSKAVGKDSKRLSSKRAVRWFRHSQSSSTAVSLFLIKLIDRSSGADEIHWYLLERIVYHSSCSDGGIDLSDVRLLFASDRTRRFGRFNDGRSVK